MDLKTEKFIYENLITHLKSHINAELLHDPVNEFLSTPVPQFTKNNAITLKQKDTFFIIQKGRSIVLGDILLPEVPNVRVLTPDVKKDGHHLLASFLVDDYDMESEVVLIVQSKANKTESFKISKGTVVWITGQNPMRVNVRQCKEIGPSLKSSGISSSNFNQFLSLNNEKQFEIISEANLKRMVKLTSNYPVLLSLNELKLLPLPGSPEAIITNLYLREGK
ncbi:hypothetical protein GCM10011607_12620 [Shewanella inventionis]|uniref:Uncharacterized protein n=1 Tax=Shewanella inventionis TaxID=1738770 RepID=A0ABQ1IXF0_9GAMM|nr:hypothetical protein [Shewanella inventionis]GGB53539.1 hypothetical protein GCM10011607_12620 [Shewanella inventionis]